MQALEGDDGGIVALGFDPVDQRAQIGIDDLVAVGDRQRLVRRNVVDGEQRGTQRALGGLVEAHDRAAIVGEDSQHPVERIFRTMLVLHDKDEVRRGELAHQ